MSKRIHAGLCDQGLSRSNNEDRWSADAAMGLYIVADGFGTRRTGALTAPIVVDGLPPLLRKHFRGIRALSDAKAPERLRAALVELNHRVWSESQLDPSLTGPGSTVVCALVWDRQVLIGHVGDSRAYWFHNGLLEQLTQDHSAVQLMVDRGEITRAQALHHPASEKLTQFIGMMTEAVPGVRFLDLGPNDQLLLCSDGLWGMVGDGEIQGILSLGQPPKDTCRLLVDAANLMGGDDNITVLIIAAADTPGDGKRTG